LDNARIQTKTPIEKPRPFYGYTIIAAAFFIFVLLDGTNYSFGVFLKPMSEELGWSRAVTAGAFSVNTILSGLLYIVTGRLNDRFGPRIVLTVCGFLFGLGYLLMSQVNALWQLYLFYGVIGAMGISGSFAPLLSTVARWFIKRRGLMTGIAVSGIGVGTVIASKISSQLIISYGWRTSYLIMGIIVLALIMLAAQFLRRVPAQKGQSPYGADEAVIDKINLEPEGDTLLQAIRTPRFCMMGVMFFCFCFVIITILTHIIPHATDLGIPPLTAANIMAIIGGVSITGRIGIGAASDRIGNRPSFILGFSLLSIALFGLLISGEQWMLYLFAVVFGLGYGGVAALISPTVAELFGLRAHGAILGAATFTLTIGGAIGPVVAGYIFDTTGSYNLAFLICASLSILGLILASLLKFGHRVKQP